MKGSNQLLTVKDIQEILDVSKSTAYRLIKEMNTNLKKQNKIIIPGKISKKYFEEKFYL